MKTSTFALLFALTIAFSAAGQTLSAGSVSATCGSQVDVPVTIDSASSVTSMEFRVSFSQSSLTLVSATTGSATSGFTLLKADGPGSVRVAMINTDAVNLSGQVAVLRFSLSATATGSLPLTISGIEVNEVGRSGHDGAISASCGGGSTPPSGGSTTLTAGNVAASCGASVDVEVTAGVVTGLTSLDFVAGYNTSALTLTAVKNGTLTKDFTLLKNEGTGSVRIGMISGNAVSGPGTVAVLTFSVAAAASGAQAISISSVVANDATGSGVSGAVTASCSNGGGGGGGGGGGTPAAPSYNAPLNDARNVAAPVVLRWGSVTGATYRVYLGTTEPPAMLNTTDRTSLNVVTQQGTKYYWRVDALTTAGAFPGPVWQFTTAGTNCAAPDVPHLNGPTTDVVAGNAFSLTWSESSGSTEYVLEESPEGTFANPSSSTHYARSVTYTHWHSVVTTKYYRIRGRNAASPCSVDGQRSNVVTVRILPGGNGGGSPRMLAVAGSLPGNAGSYFRTSLQLHNQSSGMMRGKIVFHRQGSSGSNADPAFSYDLAPGVTRSWSDVVLAFGTGTGIGSIDLVPFEGEVPLTVARIYNDGGSNGTTGVVIDAMASAEALQSGQRGQLIGPIDPGRARMNLGIRTLDSGATIDFVLRDYAGTVRQTTRRSFAGTWFEQIAVSALFNTTLVGDEVIVVEIAAGSAIVYGSITDNVTQDPAVQFAKAR